MEKGRQREIAPNDSNRFVFCSSNGAHLRWLAHALSEWHVIQQELAATALLTSRVAECRPRLILLDFSGNCGDSTANCTADMIALAQMMKSKLPDVPVVAVGTMDYPEGAVAALRAGVHHFIDMTAPVVEAHDVIYKLVSAVSSPTVSVEGALITFVGARAGVGTTTLAVHLADILQQEKSVQHKDYQIGLLDLGLPACDGQLYLNVTGNFNFSDTVRNRHRLDRTLIQTALATSHSGIKVISLPRSLTEIADISSADVRSLLSQLRLYFDVLIMDLGGFSDMAFVESMVSASDQTLLVTDQSPGSLVSLSTMLKECEKHGGDASRLQLIVNRYDIRYGMSAQQIAERFSLPLAAVMPECTLRLMSSANQGKLLHEIAKHDPYVRAVHDLAEKLLNPHSEKQTSKLSSWVPSFLKP
ncbi:AAA family ATPase [Herminiimonas arsenitoxidans]|uniref:AAA family ATPase n=1 Tax=Herminiimonas arsenitoxidans TaxID=1809410 RepID=UPI000970662C|nr:hypothetical protein [Herminiimonas arsenitoxidans]